MVAKLAGVHWHLSWGSFLPFIGRAVTSAQYTSSFLISGWTEGIRVIWNVISLQSLVCEPRASLYVRDTGPRCSLSHQPKERGHNHYRTLAMWCSKGVASGKIKSNSRWGKREQGSENPGVGSQLCLTVGQDLKLSEPLSFTTCTWQSSWED